MSLGDEMGDLELCIFIWVQLLKIGEKSLTNSSSSDQTWWLLVLPNPVWALIGARALTAASPSPTWSASLTSPRPRLRNEGVSVRRDTRRQSSRPESGKTIIRYHRLTGNRNSMFVGLVKQDLAAMWHWDISFWKSNWCEKLELLGNHFPSKMEATTLQSLMNTKLSLHRFWPCHENGLIKTIQTIPRNLYVSFKLTSFNCGLRLYPGLP